MKTFTLAIVMLLTLLVSGCASMPKPINADKSFNPSVAVAEAEISYRNAAHDATTYVTACHQSQPAPSFCNERLIAQIKVASDRAWEALQAAEEAVKTLRPGDVGLDQAINRMQAALIFLQSFTNQAKRPSTGMIENLHILEGVLA